MRKKIWRRPSPALVVALVALFVALGGTSYAALRLPENSVGTAQLKNGAVTKGKIAKKTLGSLRGARGVPGAPGTNGTNGTDGSNGIDGTNGTSVTSATLGVGDAHCPDGGSSFTAAGGTTYVCNGTKGDKGDTGAQGPAGQIVTFDATASGFNAPPTPTVLGTFLGDTISAWCADPAVDAVSLEVFIQTSDGSWAADFTGVSGEVSPSPSFSSFAHWYDYAPGSLSSPTGILNVTPPGLSSGGGTETKALDFVQSGPSPGSMTWHMRASTDNMTCHMSVQAIPETLTTTSG
jgi:hypothetical protein